MELRAYRDSWASDDPHANFKSEVALYTTSDPLPTLERLQRWDGHSGRLSDLVHVVNRQEQHIRALAFSEMPRTPGRRPAVLVW